MTGDGRQLVRAVDDPETLERVARIFRAALARVEEPEPAEEAA